MSDLDFLSHNPCVPPLSDPLGLWKDGEGSAWVKRVPPALLVSVSGECGHPRMVHLCASIGGRWNPDTEQLVLDFENLKKTDDDAARFVAGELCRMACETRGSICVVRAPLEARALLKRYLGGDDIRLVYKWRDAIAG